MENPIERLKEKQISCDYTEDKQTFAAHILHEVEKHWSVTELGRIEKALAYWAGEKVPIAHKEQDTKGFYLPGLPDEPWINPGKYGASSILLEHYPEILKEAARLVDGTIKAPPYGLANDAPSDSAPTPGRPKNWREWRLLNQNEFIDARCKEFPATFAAIKQVMKNTPFIMSAKFMILGSGEETLLHSDFNNIFVNLWLNLIAPSDSCFLEMRGEARRPEPGTMLAFNHSYIHKAYNHGDSDRVVLCISHLHHELTQVEAEVFAQLTPVFRRYVELNVDDALAVS